MGGGLLAAEILLRWRPEAKMIPKVKTYVTPTEATMDRRN